jgi:short-subunit dehydrogenase
MTNRSPQTVFITGASSGIGEALALYYAAPGRTLGLLARREALLRTVADRCRERGAEVFVYPADVSEAAAVQAATSAFLSCVNRVDLVIANAGVGARDDVAGGDTRISREVMEINFLGVVHTLAPFITAMEAAGSGSLVAVSSVAGFRGMPNTGAYSASKAAVNTWMESLRVRLRGRVHVVTVCPGFIATPMTASNPFPMPWLISADRAATLIAEGVARGVSVLVFPWQMRWVVWVVRVTPPWLFDRVAGWVRAHRPQVFRRSGPGPEGPAP